MVSVFAEKENFNHNLKHEETVENGEESEVTEDAIFVIRIAFHVYKELLFEFEIVTRDVEVGVF